MRSILLLAALLGASGYALAEDKGDKARHDKDTGHFMKADKDKDGTLTKDEAKAMPRVAKHFDDIDVDKDGTVSREEIHNYMKEKHKGKEHHGKGHEDMMEGKGKMMDGKDGMMEGKDKK